MSVYIEYVIIDNLVINFIILHLTLKSMKLKYRWYLVAIGSALGTVGSVLSPFLSDMPNWLIIAYKVFLSVVMAVSICGKGGVKRFLVVLFLIYVYTFLFGGIAFGLLYMFANARITNHTLTYSYTVPIGVIIGGVFIGYILIKLFIVYITKRKFDLQVGVQLEIFCGVNSIKTNGIVDTGNLLRDTQTGFPVAIINKNKLSGFMAANFNILKKIHYVNYTTVSSMSAKMLVFKPDKLVLYYSDKAHTIYNVMIGVSPHEDMFSDECNALVPYIT